MTAKRPRSWGGGHRFADSPWRQCVKPCHCAPLVHSEPDYFVDVRKAAGEVRLWEPATSGAWPTAVGRKYRSKVDPEGL
jgi:hypothetical protein